MRHLHIAFAAGLLLIGPAASAQDIDRDGIPFRHWDLHTGTGLHSGSTVDSGGPAGDAPQDPWYATGMIDAGIARYWTSHLKTDVAIVRFGNQDTYGSEQIVLPEGTGYAYYRIHTRHVRTALAATYQFLDNEFAHPYVSAGAAIGWLGIDKERHPFATVVGGRSVDNYSIPPINTHDSELYVRPFLAAGFKSYFSERTFLRSELSTAYTRRGLSQLTLGLGFGVDF
jgi:hypothetical protein